jgi:hypothetical protein
MNINNVKTMLTNSYETKANAKPINGLVRDEKLSGLRTQVYHDPDTQETHVVHRGTSSAQDLVTNGLLSIGLLKKTNRFKHAQKITNQAKAKYGDNIHSSGHSLGGAIAESAKGSKSVTTFNKPVTAHNIANKVKKNQTDYKNSRDPVSAFRGLQKGKKAVVMQSTTYNPYTEHKAKSFRIKK